jgi:hypothetical protein
MSWYFHLQAPSTCYQHHQPRHYYSTQAPILILVLVVLWLPQDSEPVEPPLTSRITLPDRPIPLQPCPRSLHAIMKSTAFLLTAIAIAMVHADTYSRRSCICSTIQTISYCDEFNITLSAIPSHDLSFRNCSVQATDTGKQFHRFHHPALKDMCKGTVCASGEKLGVGKDTRVLPDSDTWHPENATCQAQCQTMFPNDTVWQVCHPKDSDHPGSSKQQRLTNVRCQSDKIAHFTFHKLLTPQRQLAIRLIPLWMLLGAVLLSFCTRSCRTSAADEDDEEKGNEAASGSSNTSQQLDGVREVQSHSRMSDGSILGVLPKPLPVARLQSGRDSRLPRYSELYGIGEAAMD